MDNKRNHIPGQVVVVTGAEHGQGLELARRLSQLRMRLVLAGHNAAVLQQMAHDLAWDGGTVHAVHADLTDSDDAMRLVAAAAAAFGYIDVMVNCPPSIQPARRAAHVTPGAMLAGDSILSAVNGTLAAFEYMHGRGGGHIINVMPLTMPGTVEQRVIDASIKSGLFRLPEPTDDGQAHHGISTTLVVAPPTACTLAETMLSDHARDGQVSTAAHIPALAIPEPLKTHVAQIRQGQSKDASHPWPTRPQPLRKTA